MQFRVFGQNERNLTRSAAILLLGALSAGCSSSAMRFDDFTDGMFTSSTGNQSQIVSRPEPQPFPAAPVSPVTQSALAPVPGSSPIQRSALAPATASASALAPVSYPQAVASAPAVAQPPVMPAPATPTHQGWNSASGTQITVAPGETVYNLSKRYGVPADAIMKANGLSDAKGLAAGQQLTIPTYAYAANGKFSAPDSNPQVAAARSTVGMIGDAPATQAVMPSQPAQVSAGGYTVVSGDTLFGIAKKTGASSEAIKQANGLSTGFLRIGQTLVIPGAANSQVASLAPAVVDAAPVRNPQPEPAAYTSPARAERLVEQAALNPNLDAPDSTGIGRMRWPVRGRVIEGFGGAGGKTNDGIDIAVPEGTPVKAAENGVVIYAGDGLKEFGNTVLVRHENGLVTVYGHTSELKVARGDTVRRGQEIASSGMSGAAETPKLHFEVRKDSAPVDPSQFLE